MSTVTKPILLDETGQETVGLLSEIADAVEMIDLDTWAALEQIVASGRARELLQIGQRFVMPWTDTAANVTYTAYWVLTHFGDVVDERGVTHDGIYLQWQYATPFAISFDAAEQEVATEATFTEGWNYFTKNADGSFTKQTVTYGEAIPEGTTYYHSIFTVSDVLRYGYNRWSHSAVRQWLNSAETKGNWWEAQHAGDVAPSQASQKDGFMRGCPAEFLEVVRPVKVITAKNPIADDGQLEATYDRFFLPTDGNVYAVPNAVDESEVWDYWKAMTGLDAPSDAENTGRVIGAVDDHASAPGCLLRTARNTGAHAVRYIMSNGQLSASGSNGSSYRELPCCAIY